MSGTDEPRGPKRPAPMAYAGVGFEAVVPVVLFMWGGYLLDGWLETQPWFLLGGGVLGVALGMYSLLKRLLRLTGGSDGASK